MKNCSSKDHSEAKAITYCIECKIYMCNKCESFHSKLFSQHKLKNLENGLNEIFTGYCEEANHKETLEYYCKTHNKLCCSSCIVKIKKKDKGQHADCDFCLIEDIIDEKHNTLKNNIKKLDELSKNLKDSINELKILFEKLNERKEDLKLNIQKIFTKIRNTINDREDEILSEIDRLYSQINIEENNLKEINKLPNKISNSIKKGKEIENKKDWNEESKYSSLVNDCLSLENCINNVDNTNKIIDDFKNKSKTSITFKPKEGYDLNRFLSKIKEFGNIFKDNILIETKSNNNNKDINVYEDEDGEDRIISMELITTNKRKFSNKIELTGFNLEKYNTFFSKPVKYEEKDFILTFIFECKNPENLNDLIKYSENIKLGSSLGNPEFDELFKFSIRNEGNKIFLDYKRKMEDDDTFFKGIYYDFNNISIKLYNDFNFFDRKKLSEMKETEFVLCILCFYLSLNFKEKNVLELLNIFIKQHEQKISDKDGDDKGDKDDKDNKDDDDKEDKDDKNNKDDKDDKDNKDDKDDKENLETVILLLTAIKYIRPLELNCPIEKVYESLLSIESFRKEIEKEKNLNELIEGLNKFEEFIKLFGDLFFNINLDRFSIIVMFEQLKSGLILNIESNGLANFIEEIHSNNK